MPTVVLPCLDEALALPWVLSRLPEGWHAVVADNGSTDGSPDVAAGLGATVVPASPRGFGAACHAGLLAADEAARRSGGTTRDLTRDQAGDPARGDSDPVRGDGDPDDDVVAFCDADGSLDLQQLPRVVAPLLAGEADLVLGRRRPTERGAWPPHARLGNAVLARSLRRRTGVALTDLGPMRACRRSALLGLDLHDRRFGYPLEMVVRAAEAGWRVVEVDVDYLPRTGRSKVTGTVRGTVRTVRDMRAVLASVPPRP